MTAITTTTGLLDKINSIKSASAGILGVGGGEVSGKKVVQGNCSRNGSSSSNNNESCSHCEKNDQIDEIDAVKPPPSSSALHQIGTNLADLSVCWHKLSSPDSCNRCGQPFYDANQFLCENCYKSDDVFKAELETLSKNKSEVVIENKTTTTTDSDDEFLGLFAKSNIDPVMMMDQNLPTSLIDLNSVRRKFETELSTLLKQSTINSNGLFDTLTDSTNSGGSNSTDQSSLKSLNLADKLNLISLSSNTSAFTSRFSNHELIEQINLYNKYNSIKSASITYEVNKNQEIIIRGQIRINWNLKNPIRLDYSRPNETVKVDRGQQSLDTFKTTSIKELHEKKQKQLGWDDSSYSSSSLSSNDNHHHSRFKSHTVKYKPVNKKRPALLVNTPRAPQEEVVDQDQMFIPSYGSVSSIFIDSETTCARAIKILLDKFQVANSADEYALYKVYQTGEIREMRPDDVPLVQRLWMGPFTATDKMFIMEKGRHANLSPEVTYLTSLSDSLLSSLIQNSKTEEQKQVERLRSKYTNYSNMLADIRHLKTSS